MIKYLSLFSGIGGFEYGIQQSRYGKETTCIGYSEIDRWADSIYRRRFPNHKPLGDATLIETSDLPSFELLVAGFPCQSFSVAGKKMGFNECRGTLFFEIARILKDCRPRYFLLENVKNLLGHNKGETFKTILGILADLGYYVEWKVYNSKEFVPQSRERIFLKGYSRAECGEEILHPQGETRKSILELTPKKQPHSTQNKCYIRKLTPIEYERLQGFPDNWTQKGAEGKYISDSQRYKCCGNAVTTYVVTHIFNNWDLNV